MRALYPTCSPAGDEGLRQHKMSLITCGNHLVKRKC